MYVILASNILYKPIDDQVVFALNITLQGRQRSARAHKVARPV